MNEGPAAAGQPSSTMRIDPAGLGLKPEQPHIRCHIVNLPQAHAPPPRHIHRQLQGIRPVARGNTYAGQSASLPTPSGQSKLDCIKC